MTTEGAAPRREVVAAVEVDPILGDMSSELFHLRQRLSDLRQTLAERERQLGEARQGRAGSEQAVATLKGVLTDMVLKERSVLQSAQVDAHRSMAERLASARSEAETLVADAAAALATALGRPIDVRQPVPRTPTPRRGAEEGPPSEAATRDDTVPPAAPRRPDDVAMPHAARQVDWPSDGQPPAPPSPPAPWSADPRPDETAAPGDPGTAWSVPDGGHEQATSGPRPAAGRSPSQSPAPSPPHSASHNGRHPVSQVAELDLDEEFTKVVGLKPNTEFKTPPRGKPPVAAVPERPPGPPTVPIPVASMPSAGAAEDAFDAFWPRAHAVPRARPAGPQASGRLHFGVIDVLLPIVALTLVLVVVLSWLG